MLVLDDLQWADLPSLLLLQFLAARLRASPILVVGAYRDAEIAEPDRSEVFAALTRGALRIALAGLSVAELDRLVAALHGVDTVPPPAAQLHRRTGGNPFFAREVVRLLAARGPATAGGVVPATVSEVIEHRLARLPQPVVDLLTTVAVVGESVSLHALVAATGQPVAALVRATARSTGRGRTASRGTSTTTRTTPNTATSAEVPARTDHTTPATAATRTRSAARSTSRSQVGPG